MSESYQLLDIVVVVVEQRTCGARFQTTASPTTAGRRPKIWRPGGGADLRGRRGRRAAAAGADDENEERRGYCQQCGAAREGGDWIHIVAGNSRTSRDEDQ